VTVSYRTWQFLNRLSSCQLLKEDSTSTSCLDCRFTQLAASKIVSRRTN
jgi:hypothetical protein